MIVLIDSDGKRLKNLVKKFIEEHSGDNTMVKTCKDMICEMADNIMRFHGIEKMINKYSKASVLIFQNCEDFKNREFAVSEFLVFLKEMERRGVKIIITIEKTFVAEVTYENCLK